LQSSGTMMRKWPPSAVNNLYGLSGFLPDSSLSIRCYVYSGDAS
jgi:hypothetical protein